MYLAFEFIASINWSLLSWALPVPAFRSPWPCSGFLGPGLRNGRSPVPGFIRVHYVFTKFSVPVIGTELPRRSPWRPGGGRPLAGYFFPDSPGLNFRLLIHICVSNLGSIPVPPITMSLENFPGSSCQGDNPRPRPGIVHPRFHSVASPFCIFDEQRIWSEFYLYVGEPMNIVGGRECG
jgi:hypothetical protein